MWSSIPRTLARLPTLRSISLTSHRPPTLLFPRSSASPISRALHTTRRSYAKYERFDQRPSFGGPPGPSGEGPTLWQYIKRRMGGDRAVWVYGIGIGGGGIYYVTQ